MNRWGSWLKSFTPLLEVWSEQKVIRRSGRTPTCTASMEVCRGTSAHPADLYTATARKVRRAFFIHGEIRKAPQEVRLIPLSEFPGDTNPTDDTPLTESKHHNMYAGDLDSSIDWDSLSVTSFKIGTRGRSLSAEASEAVTHHSKGGVLRKHLKTNSIK